MKKTHIILFFLALSVIWAQKEVPGSGSTSETAGDERLNGKKIHPINVDIVQQVRMLKANKEKAFMKKQILSGQKVDKKTFEVAKEESKFLAVKQIIETIKSDKSELMIKGGININASGLKNEDKEPELHFKNNSGK